MKNINPTVERSTLLIQRLESLTLYTEEKKFTVMSISVCFWGLAPVVMSNFHLFIPPKIKFPSIF